MDIKKISIADLKAGDIIFRGSLCEVLEISSPFLRGYGHDEHYYKAESVSVKCQAVYDYDVAYAKETGRECIPSEYTFDYATEGFVFIALSGEKISITKESGVWDDKTGHYLLPGDTLNVIG